MTQDQARLRDLALLRRVRDRIDQPDSPVRLAVVNDSSYWVAGSVPIELKDAGPLETRPRVTLCRCGKSGTKPLCDGTHQKVGLPTVERRRRPPDLH